MASTVPVYNTVINFNEVFANLAQDVQNDEDERRQLFVDQTKKKIDEEIVDHNADTLVKVHDMLTTMHRTNPAAFVQLITDTESAKMSVDFSVDPRTDLLVLRPDFIEKKEFFSEYTDLELNEHGGINGLGTQFDVIGGGINGLIGAIKRITPDVNDFRVYHRYHIKDLFKYKGIPFIGYVSVEKEPDYVYLQVVPPSLWEYMVKEFRKRVKLMLSYMCDDAYFGHRYTDDGRFASIARDFGLRNASSESLWHFSYEHPWLFDIYCAVATSRPTHTQALAPTHHVCDYMQKQDLLLYPIEFWIRNRVNIDKTPMCKNASNAPTSFYKPCDRKQCSCYNPFYGKDFKNLFTPSFKRHVTITKYMADGVEQLGYTFNRYTNPNCRNCKGARAACACKGRFLDAAILRDFTAITSIRYVTVLGADKTKIKTNKYTVDFITNFDSYKPTPGTSKNFIISDKKKPSDYYGKKPEVPTFNRSSCTYYSCTDEMYKSLMVADENTIDELCAGLLTPMNLVYGDLPLDRQNVVESDIADYATTFNKEQTKDAVKQRQNFRNKAAFFLTGLKKKRYRVDYTPKMRYDPSQQRLSLVKKVFKKKTNEEVDIVVVNKTGEQIYVDAVAVIPPIPPAAMPPEPVGGTSPVYNASSPTYCPSPNYTPVSPQYAPGSPGCVDIALQ